MAMHCKCGGKYDMSLMANLQLSPIYSWVQQWKKIWETVNIYQSMIEYQVARILWPTV